MNFNFSFHPLLFLLPFVILFRYFFRGLYIHCSLSYHLLFFLSLLIMFPLTLPVFLSVHGSFPLSSPFYHILLFFSCIIIFARHSLITCQSTVMLLHPIHIHTYIPILYTLQIIPFPFLFFIQSYLFYPHSICPSPFFLPFYTSFPFSLFIFHAPFLSCLFSSHFLFSLPTFLSTLLVISLFVVSFIVFLPPYLSLLVSLPPPSSLTFCPIFL